MTDKSAGDVQQPEKAEPAVVALLMPGRIAAVVAAVVVDFSSCSG